MMFSLYQTISRYVLLISLAFFPLNAGAQSIALNEVMASNSVTLTDQDGDYEDWIELFNYGSEPVNLEGFGLSDNYDDPFRWVFPGVIIQPENSFWYGPPARTGGLRQAGSTGL
jgi:hypothetical protein